VKELARRLREVPVADAVGLAGLGMLLVGVAVTVEALIEAARSTPNASLLDWYDRLGLGLWEFRIEHTVWFTAGLLVLWWALSRGADLSGWATHAGRLAGGLAVGYALVGAAMVIASTAIALRGGVGSGPAEVTFSTRERTLVWLLQVVTGLGAGLTWALVAARLPDDVAPPPPDPDENEEPEPSPPPEPDRPAEAAPPPVIQAPVARIANASRPTYPIADPEPRALPADATPMQRAHEIFQQRLAYSPRREEARRLVEQIGQAERAGRAEEARDLVERLSRL
jgi:hypothetical protein